MLSTYPLSRWRERVEVRVDLISNRFPLTAALRHPVFPDLCKASLSAFIEILMTGCRCATERDCILSPEGRGGTVGPFIFEVIGTMAAIMRTVKIEDA
jgi:hypothetical protein